MFDTRKQSIPECFIQKIEADKQVDMIKKNKVVDFYSAKQAVLMQKVYRQKCIMAISKNSGPIIDGGSSGGGSNKAPILVDLMAA